MFSVGFILTLFAVSLTALAASFIACLLTQNKVSFKKLFFALTFFFGLSLGMAVVLAFFF